VRRAIASALGLAALTACGAEKDSQVESAAPSPSASSSLRADTVLRCGNDEVPLDRLTNPRPATGLTSAPQRVLYKFKPGDVGELASYWVVDDEPERVSIIREHRPAKGKTSAGVTYEFAAWEYVADAPNATTDWMYFGGATSCELTRTFAGLNPATTTLDPDALPQPSDRSVRLLVMERSCAGGRQAVDRVRVPVLEVTADQIRVAIGVAAQDGLQTCPAHSPTPFTLTLPEPLGERRLVDAGVYPQREITAGKNE
jgi:hypothetical protein